MLITKLPLLACKTGHNAAKPHRAEAIELYSSHMSVEPRHPNSKGAYWLLGSRNTASGTFLSVLNGCWDYYRLRGRLRQAGVTGLRREAPTFLLYQRSFKVPGEPALRL